MQITIRTLVKQSKAAVKERFTSDLFLALNPPFPPVKLKRFDGCKKGDKVALELNFMLFKQDWVSDITDDGESDQEWYFVDRGIKLPFFLETWEHRHIVREVNGEASIIDDIQFSTGFGLTDLLMYPALYLQFLYRKPIYRKYFNKKKQL